MVWCVGRRWELEDCQYFAFSFKNYFPHALCSSFCCFLQQAWQGDWAAHLTNGKPGTGCECLAKVTSSLQRRSPACLEMSHPGVLLPG